MIQTRLTVDTPTEPSYADHAEIQIWAASDEPIFLKQLAAWSHQTLVFFAKMGANNVIKTTDPISV